VDIQDQPPGGDSTPQSAPINLARRRFGRAGLGASGVILTLASEPGMAATMCKSPSGSLSGGLQSNKGTQAVVCGGLSPGYWKNHPRLWPAGVRPFTLSGQAATTFASVFPFGATQLYQTGSLMDVLKSNDPAQDPYNLGFHLVAAYLNVLSGKISYLSAQGLKDMWHDLVTLGHYEPTAGTKWYAVDIKNYLQSTEN
jgi:hypothetical protein